MAIARILRTAWIIGTAALAAACASTPLPTGTLVLGEVMRVLTRQMVDANELAPHDESISLRPQKAEPRTWRGGFQGG